MNFNFSHAHTVHLKTQDSFFKCFLMKGNCDGNEYFFSPLFLIPNPNSRHADATHFFSYSSCKYERLRVREKGFFSIIFFFPVIFLSFLLPFTIQYLIFAETFALHTHTSPIYSTIESVCI